MAFSTVVYTGDGIITDFTFNKGYLQEVDVQVSLDGVVKADPTDYSFADTNTIRFVAAPGSGVTIEFERKTKKDGRLVDWENAVVLTETSLDTDSFQAFYLLQEMIDQNSRSLKLNLAEDAVSDSIGPIVTKVYMDTDTPPSLRYNTANIMITLDNSDLDVVTLTLSFTNVQTNLLAAQGATC